MAIMPITVGAATVLTFDDIPLQGYGGPMPSSYGGLQWYNFGLLDPLLFPGNPGGYLNGMVSPSHVAFNAWANADGSTTGSFYCNSVFNFDSAYVTAAWNDSLQLTALGSLGGALIYSNTYTLNTTGPSLINFNFDGIDRVDFISRGGTPHGYEFGGTETAFDNLTITLIPEPCSTAILFVGIALVAGVNLRPYRRVQPLPRSTIRA